MMSTGLEPCAAVWPKSLNPDPKMVEHVFRMCISSPNTCLIVPSQTISHSNPPFIKFSSLSPKRDLVLNGSGKGAVDLESLPGPEARASQTGPKLIVQGHRM